MAASGISFHRHMVRRNDAQFGAQFGHRFHLFLVPGTPGSRERGHGLRERDACIRLRIGDEFFTKSHQLPLPPADDSVNQNQFGNIRREQNR
ncbi:hypothetical protein N7537_010546 [Penicillium hordei]|uniref:Uncharacterized protein n=1 Tax=Penicillium hordei TaxID=40994 RepID=A0AAD6GXP4_9EURO|nr:uncharacterized protein N7537_010546 [Penicillium hordei]KAJ5593642.1 hypothetical protein N7537_010546 [Penicillium hordei]